MSFLELKNIRKSYDFKEETKLILKGISLKFEKGEFVSILGESGGGKSTLMNIIGGLDRDFLGEVCINGYSINHQDESMLNKYRRGKVGYIFQNFNLINYQTILQNVLTSLEMTNLTNSEKKDTAINLLKDVGLGDHLNKLPNQLSGGQRQRVAIARAISTNPDIIIADEPTGALDSENTKAVLKLLDTIAKNGKLVIVVTHSQDVANFGTRILHMSDGAIDTEKNIKEKYSSNHQNSEHISERVLSTKVLWNMAFKHIKFNKLRNFWIIFGSSIGIFAILIFLGMGTGIKGYMNHKVNDMLNPNYPTLIKNVTDNGVTDDNSRIQATRQEKLSNYKSTVLTESILNKVKKIEHINSIEKGYQFDNGKVWRDNKYIQGISIQTWTAAISSNIIKIGNKPKLNEIVIDKEFAKTIFAKNWKNSIGKTVYLDFVAFDIHNSPVKISLKLKVSGIADTNNAGAVYSTSYDTIRNALIYKNAVTTPNMASMSVDKTSNVKKVVKSVNDIKSKNKRSLIAVSIGSTLNTINKITSLVTYLLVTIASISLLVSGIMIVVTTYMSVSERTKEIGILRALGARTRDIRRLFINESMLIGSFAAITGIVGAYAGELLLNAVLYNIVKYNIVSISIGNLIFAGAVSIIIAVCSSAIPAKKAAKLNIIDALSHE